MTTSQVIAMPSVIPTAIDGITDGSIIRAKMTRRGAPSESASQRCSRLISRTPSKTLMTIIKKAPINVIKMMLDSLVGQNRIDIGTQASGGIGRNNSKTGKKRFRNFSLVPNNSPTGMPNNCASRKP